MRFLNMYEDLNLEEAEVYLGNDDDDASDKVCLPISVRLSYSQFILTLLHLR
jgi:hypothetical protein